MHGGAASFVISTTAHHRVRTATVRDDMLGWVVTGTKRLVTPHGSTKFCAGEMFMIPRATQWDMVNDPSPHGRYMARVLTFSSPLVELFHERFSHFAACAAVHDCVGLLAEESFCETFARASAALEDADFSLAVRQHRALEVLLALAERGFVFAPTRELSWSDRVRRLVSQRPHAAWTVDEIARAFHLSASTLQRRLAQEHGSLSQCVREVRLETAMNLLQTTELQVSDIAARCGYESHSRFSAAFRERFGFAPSHLRS
jgi:AraC-like DNA-binding protein